MNINDILMDFTFQALERPVEDDPARVAPPGELWSDKPPKEPAEPYSEERFWEIFREL